MEDNIISFDRDEYLEVIAAGFICSAAISKNIFENEFLKNLCYTLHWQSPSLYTVQKRITDSSKRITDACFQYLSQQVSVTLMVYLWTDISKRCSISFAACSPSGTLCFLNYVQCKQENWSVSFITQQCMEMLQVLQNRQVHVGMIYFDDPVFFDTIKNTFSANGPVLPITGNTIAWCSELLTSIFTYPDFMGAKQSVVTSLRLHRRFSPCMPPFRRSLPCPISSSTICLPKNASRLSFFASI